MSAASLLDENMKFKVGAGLDELSAQYDAAQADRISQAQGNKEMAKGAASAMSAGSGLGGAALGAGLTGLVSGASTAVAAPLAGAGLALALWEQQKKSEAAEEQAKIQAAENQKTATQNAINGMINVTRGLGV